MSASLTKRMTRWYANASATWLRAEGLVDGLNLNNEDANQAVQSTNVASGVYQIPATFAQPRRFMLGTKASF